MNLFDVKLAGKDAKAIFVRWVVDLLLSYNVNEILLLDPHIALTKIEYCSFGAFSELGCIFEMPSASAASCGS